MISSIRAHARWSDAQARAQSPKGEDDMYSLVFPMAWHRKYYIFGNPIGDLESAYARARGRMHARACSRPKARIIRIFAYFLLISIYIFGHPR